MVLQIEIPFATSYLADMLPDCGVGIRNMGHEVAFGWQCRVYDVRAPSAAEEQNNSLSLWTMINNSRRHFNIERARNGVAKNIIEKEKRRMILKKNILEEFFLPCSFNTDFNGELSCPLFRIYQFGCFYWKAVTWDILVLFGHNRSSQPLRYGEASVES